MTHLGYLIAGWSIGLGTLGAYAWSIIRRTAQAERYVPVERRRWMTTDE